MRTLVLRLAALATISLAAQPALADDWTITRLRGEVLQLVDSQWLPLKRNDVVSDDRRIRTTNNGYATLVRGNETLEIGPSTQIRIVDEGGAKPYTTVLQSWGTVGVEAEVRNVEHFAVRNQYLAAVVKGTQFSVSAKSTGGDVDVERGHVSVGGSMESTLVSAGQAAHVQEDGTISVSGEGTLPAVVEKGGKSKADAVTDPDAALTAAAARLELAKATGDLKAIEAAQRAADKAEADAARAAEKAAKDAEKAAEEARKAAVKAAKDAEKNGTSGKGGGDHGDNHSGKGDDDHSGKGVGDDDGDDHSGKGSDGDTGGKGKH